MTKRLLMLLEHNAKLSVEEIAEELGAPVNGVVSMIADLILSSAAPLPKNSLLCKVFSGALVLPVRVLTEKRIDQIRSILFWCRWPDSNRHGCEAEGF